MSNASVPRCAELLIMYHADINHAAEKGETPLYLACRNGNNECVKLLLEAGADRSAETCVSLKSPFFKVNISRRAGVSCFRMVSVEAYINNPNGCIAVCQNGFC